MQQYQDQKQVNRPRVVEIDKFSLRTFYCLAYNRKISKLLAINILLSLLEFYTPEKVFKKS